jgi:FemAB-related protein (PEP-CTERM system-associated)
VLQHPRGLSYHLSAWRDAVAAAYGFKTYCLTARTGNQISGVLPLVRINLPLMPGTLVSLPYCDAAGPLADTPWIEHQLISDALQLARTMGIKAVSIRSSGPMAGIPPETTRNPGKVRMLLPLPHSADKLLASLKAKVRSQVKKPFRDGLTVQSGGRELLDDFYPLFAENMRDLGSPVHARAWIRQILHCFANRAVLFIVRMPDHTPAAGGILLCHPEMVSVPWASSLRRFNRRNPNMMLYWAFLKFAADNHYPMFDFGRSTPGEGTYSFKKQWGAAPSPLHWADFRPATGPGNHPMQPIPQTAASAASASSWKRKQAEAMIMKMPVSVSRMFGAVTRKYISL